MDSPTEKEHRLKDIANAAALLRDAADNADGGPAVVHTPYGKAVVHADKHGADVRLPGGRTVHVRRGK
jgi:hypothetical protein